MACGQGSYKKLTKARKQRGCDDILPWIKSVSNHLWWACQTCDGNAQLLKEKWLSVLHHTVNVHSWGGSDYFQQCDHPPLLPDASERIKWLTPDSSSHEALRGAVMDRNLLKALQQMTGFYHTGDLEVYHSLLLKYCEKRNHFSYEGMLARTELAALDHNYNLARKLAQTSTGMPRYKLIYPKGRNEWVAKPITDAKSYDYINGMMARVVEARHSVPHELSRSAIKFPSLPSNIAPVPRPPKDDIIHRHKSRFSNSQL